MQHLVTKLQNESLGQPKDLIAATLTFNATTVLRKSCPNLQLS